MKPSEETHILALDVRHSRIGYALFSGPRQLLDWGASSVPPYCNNRTHWIRQKLMPILRHGSPACIVTKQRRLAKLPRNATGEPILEAIRSAAIEHGISVHVIGRDELKSAFRIFRARTKDEIAWAIVGIFPELLIRLPPKRKNWQPEPHAMIVFDAIATGIAYWQRPPPRS
jgi:hypothetical protein